jgi:phosphatidylethanolamine/phosphatidyl-N-methylethanolamine N-methyltransferase
MREWNEKREVRRSYDLSAAVYDAQYSEEQKAKIEAALSHINLKKSHITLDVGCGTGLLFEHIGKSVKLLVGLDISSKILKEAKRRAQGLPEAALVCADADFMPFQNGIFDDVFAITLLQNMPNPILTLNEIKRVCKSNSIIAITGLKKKFSLDAFTKLLAQAGLKTYAIKTNGQLKGYVAVCRKI